MGMDGDKKSSCETIPELLPDSKGAPRLENVQNTQECGSTLAREVYDSMRQKDVRIYAELANGSQGRGSGFFVKDGDQVVTAAHVIAGHKQLTVKTDNGARYQAEVVKIDPLSDLALLDIKGIDKDKSRAVDIKVGGAAASVDNQGLIFTTASPGRLDGTKVLSIGQSLGIDSMYNIYRATDPTGSTGVFDQANSQDSLVSSVARSWLSRERLITSQQVLPGQSGGMAVDETGKLLGVVTSSVRGDRALVTPSDRVAALLNGDGSHTFDYKHLNRFQTNTVSAILENGFAGASLLPKVNKAAPLAYGLYRAAGMPDDVSQFSVLSGSAKWQAGRRVAEDVGFIAGGLATTLSLVPRFKPFAKVGMAVFGASATSSLIADLEGRQSQLVSITARPGSNQASKPFLWDSLEDGSRRGGP